MAGKKQNAKGVITEINKDMLSINVFDKEVIYTKNLNGSSFKVGDYVNFNSVKKNNKTEIMNLSKCYRYGLDKFIIVPKENKGIYVDLDKLLPEIITENKLNLSCGLINYTHEFSRIIGKCNLVTVSDKDTVVYAKFKKSHIYNKFVIGKVPVDSNKVSFVFKRVNDTDFLIVTAFVGNESKMSVYDPKSDESSIEFWNNKALVFDFKKIQLHTISSEPPLKGVFNKESSFNFQSMLLLEIRHYIVNNIFLGVSVELGAFIDYECGEQIIKDTIRGVCEKYSLKEITNLNSVSKNNFIYDIGDKLKFNCLSKCSIETDFVEDRPIDWDFEIFIKEGELYYMFTQ